MKAEILNYLKSRIKISIGIVITGLILSGLTAFPLESELRWLVSNDQCLSQFARGWLFTVYNALTYTNNHYSYLSYGTDWLAFAHLLLAFLFIGPMKDPVKNIWIIEFGIIACILVFPLAFIAGGIRNIPMFWRLIDCSFGLTGIIPLWIAFTNTRKLSAALNGNSYHDLTI